MSSRRAFARYYNFGFCVRRERRSCSTGFTLIELLLFSAIFAIVITVFISVLVSTTRIQVKQNAQAEVNGQSTMLLQNIQRYVERSSLVEASSDTASSTLKLRMASSSDDPTLIYISSGTVYVQQSSSAPFALTSSRVSVSDLSFTKRANPVGHDAVSVSFTISYNAPNVLSTALMGLNLSVARVSAAIFDSNIVPSANNTYKIGTAAQDWQSINNTIFFGSNGVGVGSGASTPGTQLDLAGAMTFRGMSAPSTSTAGQAMLYYDSSANALKLSQNAGAYASLGASQWTTTSTNIYYADGNVAIGSSTVGSDKLRVYGNIIARGDGTNATTLEVNSKDNAIAFDVQGSSTLATSGVGLRWSGSNVPLVFGYGSGELMRLTYDGKLGIGTTSPSYTLTVSGTAAFGDITSNGNYGVAKGTTDGADSSYLNLAGGGPGGSSRGALVILRGNENVNHGNIEEYLGNVTSSAYYLFKKDGNTALYVAGDSGSVGIHNSTPSYPLHMLSYTTWNTSQGYARFDDSCGCRGIEFGGYYNGSDTYAYIQSRYSSSSTYPLMLNPYGGNVVYVGYGSNLVNLTVYGSGTTCTIGSGTGATNCTSDGRLKKNVTGLEAALDKLMALRPIWFNWIDPKKDPASHMGLIAQEVQKIFPSVVSKVDDKYLGIDYADLVVPIIKGVQELNQKVEDLRSGLQKFVRLAADYIETNAIRANFAVFPNGATTNDSATGAPYCIRVANGQVQAVPGECK